MQILIRYNGKVLGQLRESQSVTVGRDLGNEIVLESPQVSRRHARLTLKDGLVLVEDLGSTHGTWQGKEKIKIAQFGTESEISIGGAKLQFDFSQYRIGTKTERIEEAKYETAPGMTAPGINRLEKPTIGTAINLAFRTWPYMLTRFGILLGYSIAFIIWVAIWGKIGTMFGKSQNFGIFWFLILFAPLGIFQFFLRYSLYVLKAGHIACLTKLARGEKIPDGNMVAYGKNIVVKHFVQVNVLFAVDALVKGVTRQVNATLNWISAWLPIPGLKNIMALVNQVIAMATTFIDESILSYNLTRKGEDVWKSSRDGVILYAQNSKDILIAAVWAVVFEWVLTGVLFVLCLAPAGILMSFANQSFGIVSLVVGLLFAFNIRAAFVRPILLTYILLTFHNVIEGQQPEPEWRKKLESVSTSFKDFGKKFSSQGSQTQPSQSAV